MLISKNVDPLEAASSLAKSSSRLARSMARLSSGLAVKDSSPGKPAGAVVQAQRYQAQIDQAQAANREIGNAISFSQAQQGYLGKVSKTLDRLAELAARVQDDPESSDDIRQARKEFSDLAKYINSVAAKGFNGTDLFSPKPQSVVTGTDGANFAMPGVDLGASAYSQVAGAGLSDSTSARQVSQYIANAKAQLSKDLATVEANITFLSNAGERLNVQEQNLSSASSGIANPDRANESTERARFSILDQANAAALAQANPNAQSVLRLLG